MNKAKPADLNEDMKVVFPVLEKAVKQLGASRMLIVFANDEKVTVAQWGIANEQELNPILLAVINFIDNWKAGSLPVQKRIITPDTRFPEGRG